ncbi:MAG: N-acetylmuramoyl-L-alanine amidase [Firmicutes bacterium]|nr:N-acetylmuramoyl-L-alanine amidase [Bacillota bacterium]
MRKIMLVLLIILITVIIYYRYQPEAEIRVYVNNEQLAIENPVIKHDSGFMIPAQPLLNELGFEILWNNNHELLTAAMGNYTLEIPLGTREIEVNSEIVNWVYPAELIDDLVYLPLISLQEVLGLFVEWDEDTGIIYITTPQDQFDPIDIADQKGPLLNVAYPPVSGFKYYGDKLFVFGTTESFKNIDVLVNGVPVEILDQRTGNFLTMVSIPRGEEYSIVVEASDGKGVTVIERTVLYPGLWQAMPGEPLAIHPTLLIPGEDQILKAGDPLRVAFQGSSGGEASFWIGDNSNRFSMTELAYPAGPAGEGGIYAASYQTDESFIPDSGISEPMKITISLKKGEEEVIRELPGRITIFAGPFYKIIEIRDEYQLKNRGWLYMIQDGPVQIRSDTLGGAGYSTNVIRYLIEGTRYEAIGMLGNYYRVKPQENETFLIHSDMVRILEGKGNLKPLVSQLDILDSTEKVSVLLKTTERFPFLIEDGIDKLELQMYGLKAAENLISPRLPDSVRDLSIEVDNPDDFGLIMLNIELDYKIAGFRSRWVGTELVLDIFKAPSIDVDNPLEGKTIIIDPGHGGIDTGAIGPGEIHEKDVVLAMGLYLQELLEEEGVNVIMTRTGDEFINLYDRPERIDSYDPDFFISIHVNAHAHNAPATEIRGLMILYNYAHNEELAEIMLLTMDELTDLPAFRTWRRNIAVIRHSHVPSVLVEAGYLMHPEDNWYILHPWGQKVLAQAMKEGIKRYFLSLQDSKSRNN